MGRFGRNYCIVFFKKYRYIKSRLPEIYKKRPSYYYNFGILGISFTKNILSNTFVEFFDATFTYKISDKIETFNDAQKSESLSRLLTGKNRDKILSALKKGGQLGALEFESCMRYSAIIEV